MAPPNFPNCITLHSIGYAALKYPDLAAELPVPLANQVGVLQRVPSSQMDHMIAQIASQYLTTLLEYQCSDDPHLHDRSSPQYWFSSAMCLMNFLTTSPDVCIHIAGHPSLLHDTVEKLLDPTLETSMRACNRGGSPQFPATTFEDDFGCLLQFLSTILLYPEYHGTLPPRINELVPKLKTWERTYRLSHVKTISNASNRLVPQIHGMDLELIRQMRKMQCTSLVCGYSACGNRTSLTACSGCRVQRYCSREHQKGDWKYHKYICKKGLVEAAE